MYSMAVGGKSFYIGIGHSARASDRVRYVRYLLARQKTGNAVNWVMSNEVIARLLRGRLKVAPKVLRSGLNRRQALEHERQIIEWFRRRGVILANRQHNEGFKYTAADVLKDIRRRLSA